MYYGNQWIYVWFGAGGGEEGAGDGVLVDAGHGAGGVCRVRAAVQPGDHQPAGPGARPRQGLHRRQAVHRHRAPRHPHWYTYMHGLS